jgi:hypothetical protein
VLERIVFHIGMHKTGTTAIQVSLGKAYDSLLSRGILYPRAGRVGPGHAQVARDLMRTDAPAAELPSHLGILDEVRTAGPATLIVSSEDLLGVRSPRPVEWARHLCEELQPARVDVLGYVRPQWDQVESLYAAWVRTGRSWAPFDQVLETMMVDRRFDYLETFSSWRQAFGDRLELRPYGADVLVGGDAVTDFWSSVGLGTPTEPPRHANPRSGARTTEMLRLLRAFLADHHLDGLVQPAEPDPRAQQRAIQEMLRRARRRIEAAFADDRSFSPLTQEMVMRIAAHFAASNEQFVQTYFGGRHESLFSPPNEPREPSTWSLSDASEDERRFFAQLVGETLTELWSASAGAPGRAASPSSGARPAPRRHAPPEGEGRHLAPYLRRARGRLRHLLGPLRKG